MSIPNFEQKPSFGANEGVWEYYTYDGDFIGYIVRKPPKEEGQRKYFVPWTFQNNAWTMQWWEDNKAPFYNAQLLKLHPDKPVMIVEGEKTADAATVLFPEFVCITWKGGAQGIKNTPIELLQGRKICLWPDNDDAGINAMEKLKERLQNTASCIYMVLVNGFGVEKSWDLADFTDNCEVDLELVSEWIKDGWLATKEFSITSYPEIKPGKNPIPYDTSRNFKHLLDFYKIVLRWNIMKRECEVYTPFKTFYYEEKDNQALTYLENLAELHSFKQSRVAKHMDYIALDNMYHPIRDWILSKPLQKSGYLEDFLTILETTDNDFARLLLKRWMLSAIAVLFNEGEFVAQGVLVLQGEGGWRKTTFISMLAPSEFKAIKKGSELDPSNKDNLIRLAKYWIAELGELGGTINKTTSDKLKSHVTNELDEARRSYAAKDSQMIRRTIYAGTVNDQHFLVDETGNRRWWVITLTKAIDTERMKTLDMQQIWREVYELYLSGERAYLNDEEVAILNESNKKHDKINPFAQKLEYKFNWNLKEKTEMNATAVLEHIGFKNPTRAQATSMAMLLRDMKIPLVKRSVYLMPQQLFEIQEEF